MGTIYKVTNTLNGKIYIGKTKGDGYEYRYGKNFRRLKSPHEGINRPFYKAIQKYKLNNFIFENIEQHIPPENLDSRETFWITHYQSNSKKGYNCTTGGNDGFKQTKNLVNRKKITSSKYNEWYYTPEKIIFKGTRNELANKFPQHKLNICKISRISSGVAQYYKGWILLKNKDKDLTPYLVYKWVHPTVGKIQCKITELVKRFPEMKLSVAALCSLRKYNNRHHKGWTIEGHERPIYKVYDITNVVDNRNFKGNKDEIKINLGLDKLPRKLHDMLNNKKIMWKNWSLTENICKISLFKQKLNWINGNNMFNGTVQELQKQYNLPNCSPLYKIVKKQKGFKSYYGWRLS